MRWRPATAGIAAAIGAGILFAVGLAAGRFDVAVIGVPIAAGVAWGWITRPRGPIGVERGGLIRGLDPGDLAVPIDLATPRGSDAVQLRLQAPGYRTTDVLIAAGDRRIRPSISTVHTGRMDLFPVDAIALGIGGATRSEPVDHPPLRITVLPRVQQLTEMPLPFRLQGLTGGHGSPRIGSGGDLRDVNVFSPGDRLRRIDWRVTSRRAGQSATPANPGRITELYVRRTFAVADATIMLVIDSRDEVGSMVSTWGDLTPPRHDHVTSLDLTREAAASVARQYLELGDRVGLQDLGRSRTRIAPAGGRRQLQRLTQGLARSEPEGEPLPRVRAPILPSGSLVVIFSTFLDDQPSRLARLWRYSGHRVIAVDILPVLDSADLTEIRRVAFSLIRLEREDRLAELNDVGIDLVRWQVDPLHPDRIPSPRLQWVGIARKERRR